MCSVCLIEFCVEMLFQTAINSLPAGEPGHSAQGLHGSGRRAAQAADVDKVTFCLFACLLIGFVWLVGWLVGRLAG